MREGPNMPLSLRFGRLFDLAFLGLRPQTYDFDVTMLLIDRSIASLRGLRLRFVTVPA